MTAKPRQQAESVGARLRALRIDNGMTQDALARAIGVSRSAVAQWETDRAGQVNGNLTRVAAALGVSLDVLLNGHESHAAAEAGSGDELALLRLYRSCNSDDKAYLLRTAKLLASAKTTGKV